jgi:GAG-pre-integrase domain
VVFDIEIPTPRGVIYAMYLQCGHEVATAAKDNAKMTIKQAHDKLGHCNEEVMRKIAKQLGWELSPGSLGVCEACTIGKARQKKVPKLKEDEPAKPGE